MFKLQSPYKPAWDQPKAIKQIIENFKQWKDKIVLLWATWTWKTFTMANIIQKLNLPTLVLSHNKTLAAQLSTEFKAFFPLNAVHYFVSYFDYYQPESYIPEKDMYIEKDSSVNQDIQMYRLSAMSSLISRKDVIIVSSVSAIYWLWSKADFASSKIQIKQFEKVNLKKLKEQLLTLQYKPNKTDFQPWTFYFRWNMLDIYSSVENAVYRIYFDDDIPEYIEKKDPVSWKTIWKPTSVTIWSATQFLQLTDDIDNVIKQIYDELQERIKYFTRKNELLFAQRIKQRVEYDLKMIKETGFTQWIENYSRYFEWRNPGEPPETIFDYYPDEFLLIIDESHMTIPQFQAMWKADRSRKQNLIDYWFRLPSAADHRPLTWEEVEYLLTFKNKNQLPQSVWIDYIENSWRRKKKVYVLFVSATPAEYELKLTNNTIVEQIIRPTWLVDPVCYVYPKSWDYKKLEEDLNLYKF